MRFTGKERDLETGLDYLGARYMSAVQGRFTSPDPHNPLTEYRTRQELEDYQGEPQNWNRYAYTRNNPLKFIDPDGKETKLAKGGPTKANPIGHAAIIIDNKYIHSVLGMRETTGVVTPVSILTSKRVCGRRSC